MTWFKKSGILFMCIFAVSFAQAASNAAEKSMDRKLMLSREIWSPIFAAVVHKKERQRLHMTKQQFRRVNESFYRAYADYLNETDLILIKKMYKTKIGNKIAENAVRKLFGLNPLRLTYNSFSKKDKAEWEAFARQNYKQVRLIEKKMKGFTKSIQSRLAHKTP